MWLGCQKGNIMKIAILKEITSPFNDDQYVVDLHRKFEGYEPGDLICGCTPFVGLPLRLEIAIRKNGELVFRKWEWVQFENYYFHTTEISENEYKEIGKEYPKPFIPTNEQIDTVNGLFSGRITFDGLKLAPGASLQKICPVNVKREEELIGKKIYLA